MLVRQLAVAVMRVYFFPDCVLVNLYCIRDQKILSTCHCDIFSLPEPRIMSHGTYFPEFTRGYKPEPKSTVLKQPISVRNEADQLHDEL